MNRSVIGLALILLVFATSSCGIFRRAPAENAALPERSARFLMKKMAQQQVRADWLSARARIQYEDDDLSVSATANLRMRKDSIIWANVKKLNIEVGRALIRPDSFFVIDRINREYSRYSMSALADMFQVPANFQVLQAILLGNPFFLNADHQSGIEDGLYSLKGEDSRFSAVYYLDGRDYSLVRAAFTEKRENRKVIMDLKEYGPLGKKQNFSYFRTVRMETPDAGPLFIEIEFSKVELNIPKSIEFEIPSRYNEINQP